MEERRIIQGAFLVSLLLHLMLAAATWRLPLNFAEVGDPAAALQREVELLLEPAAESDAAADAQRPTAFTTIPDRLASETPPDDPQFLALHHSRAADRTPDDAGEVPAADEAWDHPQVEVRQEELSGAEGVEFAPQALPDPRSGVRSQETGAAGGDERRVDGQESPAGGDWALPRQEESAAAGQEGERADAEKVENPDLAEWWGGQSPSILKEGDRGATGDRGFDFNQASRGKVGAGVSFDGEFSLNTYEWEYAPWMTRFTNELHRHWKAPYAYRLGVIDGMTGIRLVIEKDGRPSTMEIIETVGHESLHDASLAALKAFAPYAPLPPQFPEDRLVITLGLYYPAWRR